MIKLAIDAMGGDFAPENIVKGVNLAVKEYSDVEYYLYGDEDQIKVFLEPNERVHIIDTKDKVDMGEKDPIGCIRRRKTTSLAMAFAAVANGECDGVVTAGPTQVVIPAAHMIIKKIKGMSRVALCPALPYINGKSRLLLDVGANVELRSEHILQLAQYASIYLREMNNVEKPLVGLINIGSEPGKGREVDREAFNLLSNDPHINFFGNVEPKELLTTDCDILITDGFSGNLVMKTTEGVASVIGRWLKDGIKSKFRYKIGYLFMKDLFADFKKTMSSDEVGGSNVFGVNGVVVKAHGASGDYAFSRAIGQARRSVAGGVVEKMKAVLATELEKDE